MKYLTKKTVGLVGLGTVGKGFYKIFKESDLETKGVSIKVFDIDRSKTRVLLDEEVVSSDLELFDSDIDILIELIDNSEASFELAKKCVLNNILFITANKKMLADNINYLSDWLYDGRILYEASVAGSIPIIRTIKDYYSNQNINSIRGILNGSCNYILTKIYNDKLPFKSALAEAQEKGFAESDPTLDISGKDSLYKSIILAQTVFGVLPENIDIDVKGITQAEIKEYDLSRKLKLVSTIYKKDSGISITVQPEYISLSDPLADIDYEYNCVEINNDSIDKQLYTGKGAGALPTGSAVFSDLIYAINNLDTRQNKHQIMSIH